MSQAPAPHLGPDESADLERLEAVVGRGLETFMEVGGALAEIRDRRLYRREYGTFEEYCRRRWAITDRRARQLMSAAKVVSDMSKTGNKFPVPTSDLHAAPLAEIPGPEEKAEAWAEAVGTAPDGKVTARHVKRVVAKKLGKPDPEAMPGTSRVNGVLDHDPPDIARAREAGRIAPDVVVDITEPGEPPGAETPAPDPDELESDEAWLGGLPARAGLSGGPLATFDSDALIYRRLESARETFRYHAARALKAARRKGFYAYLVSRFLKLDHPKHWLVCPRPEDGGCDGTGQVPLIGQCSKCKGRGYWIK